VRAGAPGARRARRERSTVRAPGGVHDRARPEQPLPATPQLRFTPPEVVLYRSWLAPEGATYEALASCELTPEEP